MITLGNWFMKDWKEPEPPCEYTSTDCHFQGHHLEYFERFKKMDGGEIFIVSGGVYKLFREQDYYPYTNFLYSLEDWDGKPAPEWFHESK